MRSFVRLSQLWKRKEYLIYLRSGSLDMSNHNSFYHEKYNEKLIERLAKGKYVRIILPNFKGRKNKR